MRYIFPSLCTVILLCISLLNHAQYWGISQGSYTIDESMDLATLPNGDMVMCGYFTSSFPFMGQNLVNAGMSDLFVARLTPSGSLVWVTRAGGITDERAVAIDVDNTGNIYIGGHFSSTTTLGNTTLTSAGQQDIFIAKLDGNGQFLWATSGGGNGQDVLYDIAWDGNGNVAATGEFSQTATFGINTFTAVDEDVYVIKLDGSGNYLWARHGTGPHADRGMALDNDPSGNLYITGQYNLNFTFNGNLHTNNLYNSIFLLKLDAAGNEVWFKKIGGGLHNIAYDIHYKSPSELYLTGDFEGSIVFFPNTSNPINSAYPYSVFLSRLTDAGVMSWTSIVGSHNRVTARKVITQPNGDVYIGGMFECSFTEAALSFGTGAFYSLGYQDVFMAKFNSSGARQWMRHLGSAQNDFSRGISYSNTGEPFYSMSYEDGIYIPASNTYIGGNIVNLYTLSGCSDPYHNLYAGYGAIGNKDFIFGKLIDPARTLLYYFDGPPYDCNYDFIFPDITAPPNDTIIACAYTTLEAQCHAYVYMGTTFTYQWSTGSTISSTLVNTGGWYSVTVTRQDGCYSKTDSVFVIIHPNPAIPLIWDDIVVNTAAQTASRIDLCAPDSALLWTAAIPHHTYQWQGPVLNPPGDTSCTVTVSGFYHITATDTNGCTRNNTVEVSIYNPLTAWNPALYFCHGNTCVQGDTLVICADQHVQMIAKDSLTPYLQSHESVKFYYVEYPMMDTSYLYHQYPVNATVPVDSSRWYYFKMVLMQHHFCDTIYHEVFDSVYITILPVPTPTLSISGPHWLCPGDTNLYVISGCNDSLIYPTNGLDFIHGDTVGISHQGGYSFYCYTIDSNGCDATAYQTLSVYMYQQPVLTTIPSHGVVCPFDSVQIIANIPGSYSWYGPQGFIGVFSNSIYGLIPGFYYAVLNDSSGCNMYSNTVELKKYATPYIAASPRPSLCHPDDSVKLLVYSSTGSMIQWLPPLSGSDSTLYVQQPGLYSAVVTFCNITDTAHIFIDSNHAQAFVMPISATYECEGDTVFLVTPPGNFSHFWLPGHEQDDTLYVTHAGAYAVVAIDSIGCSDTSAFIQVQFQVHDVTPPLVNDTLVCFPDSITLTAYGSGIIRWYDAPDGGTLLFTGAQYHTGIMPGPDTFYVSRQIDSCTSIMVPVIVGSDICDTIFSPNVFSPNGDGINDFIDFGLKNADCFLVEIYNRWGIIVRRFTDSEDAVWKGENTDGKMLSDGVYHYIMEYCPKDSPMKRKIGFVHLFQNP